MPELDPLTIRLRGDLADLRASFRRAKVDSRSTTAQIASDFEKMGKKRLISNFAG